MKESGQKKEGNQKSDKTTTFPIPFSFGEANESIFILPNQPMQDSREQKIEEALQFHSQGNISEAEKYYQSIINQGCKDPRVFSNYGVILKRRGELEEAELSTRKAIELNPDFPDAHCNLGTILIRRGKLEKSELSLRTAIKLNPDYADAHYNLGNILRDLGKFKEARLCSEKIMSLRSWSIAGSYSFNYEMKLD